MANDPAVAQNFSPSNLSIMRAGNAPYAVISQQRGGRKVYELDHHIEIREGGAVYNLDNIETFARNSKVTNKLDKIRKT